MNAYKERADRYWCRNSGRIGLAFGVARVADHLPETDDETRKTRAHTLKAAAHRRHHGIGCLATTLNPIFSALAWPLIFGQLASTVFTLLVIPVTDYALFRKKHMQS